MRDFNFKNDADTSVANIAGVRPDFARPDEEIQPVLLREEIIRPEEQMESSEPLRPSHSDSEEESESNNLPKLAAAAIVGILIVGGGIYAYESTTASQQPSVKTVAMNSTAPAKVASTGPSTPAPAPATSTENSAQTTPDQSAKAPVSHAVKRASRERAPASARIESADNAPAASSSASSDAAINAPMTLTPEDAPPPQASSPSQTAQSTPAAGETAMEQPLTAPNVSGANGQPTPEVATNNGAAATPAPAPVQTAPADQTGQQPQATIQPQVQPQATQPAQ